MKYEDEMSDTVLPNIQYRTFDSEHRKTDTSREIRNVILVMNIVYHELVIQSFLPRKFEPFRHSSLLSSLGLASSLYFIFPLSIHE